MDIKMFVTLLDLIMETREFNAIMDIGTKILVFETLVKIRGINKVRPISLPGTMQAFYKMPWKCMQ